MLKHKLCIFDLSGLFSMYSNAIQKELWGYRRSFCFSELTCSRRLEDWLRLQSMRMNCY